jgi:hypothetical protein
MTTNSSTNVKPGRAAIRMLLISMLLKNLPQYFVTQIRRVYNWSKVFRLHNQIVVERTDRQLNSQEFRKAQGAP